MGGPYSAQIQQALREFLREHPGGDGSGDVVGPGGALDGHLSLFDGSTGRLLKDGGVPVTGPGSAVSGHLAVFSGTSGKLLADGGAVPSGGGGGGLPASTGANKVLFDNGMTQDWSGTPILAGLTLGTTHPFDLQPSATLDDHLLVGTPPETGVTVTITPAIPTGEASNGSVIRLVGGDGSGGGNVFLVGGNDTSAEGNSPPANVWLVGGYADHSEARGSVVVDSPYLNFSTTAGVAGYGLRDNAGTIEAKNSGGEWAALGGGGGLPAGLDYTADVLTLGVAGAPTNGQTILPAPSTDAGGASLQLLATAAIATDGFGGSVFISGGSDFDGSNSGGNIGVSGATPGGGGGPTQLVAGSGNAGGGDVVITAGSGSAGDASAGSVQITAGTPSGGGNPGTINLHSPVVADGTFAIPAIGSDTEVLFNDGGALGADAGLSYVKPLATPAAPTVTPQGTPETTAYEYVAVAVRNGLHSIASDVGATATGAASLDGTNFNRIAWSAVAGATSYNIYRVTGGDSQGLVATGVTDVTVDDTGLTGDGSTAPADANSGVFSAQTIELHGPLVSASDTLTLGLPGAPTSAQTIQPAASTSGNVGGSLYLVGQSAGATTGAQLSIEGAGAEAEGVGGAISFSSGNGTGAGGDAVISAGGGISGDANGGSVIISGGPASGTGSPGVINLYSPVVADHPITAPDFILSGSALKPDAVDGHAAHLQAYDVDGTAYVDFITLTNGNTPTCVVKATDFQSGDGSSGVSTSIVIPAVATITIKNGLITAVV